MDGHRYDKETGVLWLWNPKWMAVEERGFVDIEIASFQMDRVLVACGIVDSRTNAQRLLKSNSVSWRLDDGVMDWTKVTDFRQELESGWPIVLKVGNGHWRTLQVETKPKSFPSLATVMRPMWVEGMTLASEDSEELVPFREFQSIDVWTDLWRQSLKSEYAEKVGQQ